MFGTGAIPPSYREYPDLKPSQTLCHTDETQPEKDETLLKNMSNTMKHGLLEVATIRLTSNHITTNVLRKAAS